METFKKLPLGGVDRRAMVTALAERGMGVARSELAAQRATLTAAGTGVAKDAAVLILGGSNGITRSLALQLLFAEGTAVYGVHYDSEKMQIGPAHVAAITESAEAAGVATKFWNADATRPDTVTEVVAYLKERYRAVHLVNGIAAGATKRYVEHGPTQVKDLDVAFDSVLQTPDFSKPENLRRVGLVDVEVATDVDIERTNKFMGSSSLLWAEPLAEAGLLVPGESIVAFCDYDFPADDPVYAMGPLAGAKVLQRQTMATIRERFGARTARLCYPAVCTTALGAIPGGLLMYALSAEILLERGQYVDLLGLAHASMRVFRSDWDGADLYLDRDYQAAQPEFHARKGALDTDSLPGAFARLLAFTAEAKAAGRV